MGCARYDEARVIEMIEVHLDNRGRLSVQDPDRATALRVFRLALGAGFPNITTYADSNGALEISIEPYRSDGKLALPAMLALAGEIRGDSAEEMLADWRASATGKAFNDAVNGQ